MKVGVSRATLMPAAIRAMRASHWAFHTTSFSSWVIHRSSSSWVPLASRPLPSMDSTV